MTTDYKGALDEIFSAINIDWLAKTTSIAGYVPKIYWPGDDDGAIPDSDKFWARISTQSVLCDQATLSENVVINGSKRFVTYGLVFFQLFAPKRSNSETVCLALAKIVQKTLRKSTANVILHKARIQELPPENGAIRKNIIAKFQFDEIN